MKENLKILLFTSAGILLALVCIVWGVNLRQRSAEERRILPKLKKQEALSEITLSLSPRELTQYQGENFTVNILINSEKRIVAADLYLSYDNQILEIEKVVPGKFFAEPKELSKEINKVDGKIFYALGSFSPTAGKGILISLTFKGKAAGGKAHVLLEKNTQVVTHDIEKVNPALLEEGVYTILKSTK